MLDLQSVMPLCKQQAWSMTTKSNVITKNIKIYLELMINKIAKEIEVQDDVCFWTEENEQVIKTEVLEPSSYQPTN